MALQDFMYVFFFSIHDTCYIFFPKHFFLSMAKTDLFSLDIGDMSALKQYNKGFRYYLIFINAWTKLVQVEILMKKDAMSTTKATENMLDNHLKMVNGVEFSLCLVDEGKEFLNKQFTDLMQKRKIKIYHTFSGLKSAIIES